MNVKYLLLPLFLSAAVLAIHVFCLASTAAVPSPVMVAFSAEGTHGVDRINVYSEATGLRCVVRSSGVFNTSLYGYDAASDTWLLDLPFRLRNGPGRLVKLERGKKSVIRLSEFPENCEFPTMRFTQGMLVVLYVKGTHLVLNNYRLDGSLKSRRTLKIPARGIVQDSASFSIMRSGLVAADMVVDGSKGSTLYVFDNKGLLKETIEGGALAQFDPEGRRLAYRDFSYTASASSEDQAAFREHVGNIIIYDLTTKAKRTIATGVPPLAEQSDVPRPVVLSDFCWSPDGCCLVCSYTQGDRSQQLVYVVDISSDKPVWRKLPIEPSRGCWTVVDKMPPAH